MKMTTLKSVAIAVGLASSAFGQATSPVVGYVSLGNNGAVPANSDVAISIPLHQSIELSSSASSSSATSLSLSDTTITDGQFNPVEGEAPFCVVVTDGDEEGLIGIISSNVGSDLELMSVNGSDFSTVSADDSISIFRCWTLSTLFPSDLPAGTRLLAYGGVTPGTNISSDIQFVFNGSRWLQLVGGSGFADDVVLHPGESFVLRAGNNPVSNLVVAGTVPVFNSRATITKLAESVAQETRFSYFGGVGDSLIDSGLGFSPGDRVLGFDNVSTGINKSASEILVWNGTSWLGLAGVSGPQNDFVLESGRGYVYQRVAGAEVGDIDWIDEQSYRSNLQN